MHPQEPVLSLRELRVEVGERSVLRSVTLDVPRGALLVLMGANGSGKSTLGLALAGHPRYRVSAGQARFAGQDLLAMAPEQRAQAGLFLSFQAPPEIPGVKNNLFIRTALNAVREARGTAFIVVSHYLQMIEALAPDAVLVLDQGCIAERGDLALARRIARTGFAPKPAAVETT